MAQVTAFAIDIEVTRRIQQALIQYRKDQTSPHREHNVPLFWNSVFVRPGDRFSKVLESFRARKANIKSPQLKNKKILSFETLHKCKLYLNGKLVEINSSVNQALHGF